MRIPIFLIVLFSLSASIGWAQGTCPGLGPISLNATDTNTCPGQTDTLYLSADTSTADYDWYLLNSQNWAPNVVNGNISPVEIETASDGHTVFGMFFVGAYRVYKLDGGTWVSETSTLPMNEVPYSLAISDTNGIYVASRNTMTNRISVWYWNGFSWLAIGAQNFTTTNPMHVDLEIDHLDRPLIAFANDSTFDYVTVMRYSGASWGVLGNVQANNGVAFRIDLEVSSTNVPYFGVIITSAGFPLQVYSFNGTAWSGLTAGITSGFVDEFDLELIGNTPYIGYEQPSGGDKVYLEYFSGGSWISVAPFDGSTLGTAPQMEVSNGELIFSYQSSGATKFLNLSNGSWSTYMVDGPFASFVNSVMKLGEQGFPVVNGFLNFQNYVGLPFNTNPNDTAQVVNSSGLYLTVSHNTCGDYQRSLLEIGNEPVPNYSLSFTNLACAGDSNGTIEVLHTGSEPILSYSWNTGETTAQIVGKPAGTYTVQITGNHCVLVDSAVLFENSPPVTTFSVTSASCAESESPDGQIQPFTSGGTWPYVYAINGLVRDSSALSTLQAGVYDVVTRDGLGCTVSNSVTVGALNTVPAPVINGGVAQTLCADSMLLSVPGNTYASNEWRRWTDLAWQPQYASSIYDLDDSDIFLTRSGDLIFGTDNNATNGIRKLSNGVTSLIGFNPGGPNLSYNKMEYKDGWLLYARYTNSALTIYRRSDTATQWEEYPALPFASSEISGLDFCFLDGQLYVSARQRFNIGDTNFFLRHDPTINGWEFLENVGTGLATERLETSEDGTIYALISGGGDEMIVRSFDGQAWTTILSGIQTAFRAKDLLIQDNVPIVSYIPVSSGPCYTLSYQSGTWTPIDTIAGDRYRVIMRRSDNGRLFLAYGEDDYDFYSWIEGGWKQMNAQTIDADWDLDFQAENNGTLHVYIPPYSNYTILAPEVISMDDSVYINEDGYYSFHGGPSACLGAEDFHLINPAPAISADVVTEVTCNGDSDGELTVNIDPATGTGGFSILWSTSSIQSSIQNLDGGVYSVSVTDDDNCLVVDSVNLFEPDSLHITQVIANAPNCVGEMTGTAEAEMEGGRTPYAFNWSPFWGTVAYDSVYLAAGNYQLFVSDSVGCTDSLAFNIPVSPNSVSIPSITPGQASLCGLDSITLTASSSGSQYQWYDLETGGWSILGGTDFRNSIPYGTPDVMDMEVTESGFVYVATASDDYNNQGISRVHFYDGIAWSQYGTDFNLIEPGYNQNSERVRTMAMELDSTGAVVVAYTNIKQFSDVVYVQRWNGAAWDTIYSAIQPSGDYVIKVELERNRTTNKLWFAYSLDEVNGVNLLELNVSGFDTLSYSPVGNNRTYGLDLEFGFDNNMYLMTGVSTNWQNKELFRLDNSSATSLDVSLLPDLPFNSKLSVNASGELHVHAVDGIYQSTGNGAWSKLGVQNLDFDHYASEFKMNAAGKLYWSHPLDDWMFNGQEWIVLDPNGNVGVRSLGFSPEGMPLVAAQSSSYYAVKAFSPDEIAGANSASFTAEEAACLWVTASEGSCSQGNGVNVSAPFFAVTENDFIDCPGDSTILSVTATGFGDSVSYLWNTGDTTSSLGYVVAGVFTVTVTGNACPSLVDTIEVLENVQLSVLLDSTAAASCPTSEDGFAAIEVTSALPYAIAWQDNLSVTSLSRSGLSAKDYTVIAAYNGCPIGDTLAFQVAGPPAFDAPQVTAGQSQTICDNDSILLSATAAAGVNVSWRSYDSTAWETFGMLDVAYDEQTMIEQDGEIYLQNADPQGNHALYRLNGERWDLVWSDSVEYEGVGDMAIDSTGNIYMMSMVGSFASGELRVVRVGVDTTELFSIPTGSSQFREPKVEWYNGQVHVAYILASGIAGDVKLHRFNGTSVETVLAPVLPEAATFNYNAELLFEADYSGNLWVGVYDVWSNAQLHRYDGTSWNLEQTKDVGFGPKSFAIHGLKDGSLWAVMSDNSSFQPHLIVRYQSAAWDTIEARHSTMQMSHNSHDLSEDVFGRVLMAEEGNLYAYEDTNWLRIDSGLTQTSYSPVFVDRSCTFPAFNLDDNEVLKPLPLYVVANGASVYVSSPGVYQPVAEQGGCENFDACPVALNGAFDVTIEVAQAVLCANDSNAHLRATSSGAFSGSLNYVWSNGESTVEIDSLAAGTYSVTASDGVGCQVVDSVTIANAIPLTVQAVSITANDCGGNANGAIQLTAAGGSGTLSMLWSNGYTAFSINNLTDTTYTATISDTNACSIDTAIVLNSLDTIAPTLSAQDVTLYLDANGEAVLQSVDVDPGIGDNCAIESIVFSTDTFSCSEIGTQETYITVTDSSGNAIADTFNVTIVDTTAPNAQAAIFDVYLDANGAATLLSSQVDGGSSDNCSIDSIHISKTSFNCADLGADTLVFTVTDSSGNTDSLEVYFSVLDSFAPVISPSFLVAYNDSFGTATVDSTSILSLIADNCAIDTAWWSPATFYCSAGIDSVTIYATDGSGNTDSVIVPISIVDSTFPTLLTYQQVNIYLAQNGLYTLSASELDSASFDNCGIDTLYASADSLDCGDVGSTMVQLTAEDSSGNTTQMMVNVIVWDTFAPTVLTQNAMIYLDANGVASLSASQVDNGTWDSCGVQSMALSQDQFDCSDLGNQNVWFIATDVNGNSDSALASVQVLDTIAPNMLVKSSDTVYIDASGSAQLQFAQLDLGTTDNCGSITSSFSISSFFCSSIGAQSVFVTVSDASGNSVTQLVTIHVVDAIDPVIDCPTSEDFCEGMLSPVAPPVTDNCSATIVQTGGPTSGSVLTAGTFTMTYEATDNSGNSSACSYQMEVQPAIVTNLGNDTTINQGQSLTLTAGPSNWDYAWSTGGTTASETVSPMATETVSVIATLGACSDEDSILINVIPTGIEALVGAGDALTAFPNPTDGSLTLRFSKAATRNVELRIFAADGSLVMMEERRLEQETTLNLHHLAQGIYWIDVRDESQRYQLPVTVK